MKEGIDSGQAIFFGGTGCGEGNRKGLYHADYLTSVDQEISDCFKGQFLGEVETAIKSWFAALGANEYLCCSLHLGNCKGFRSSIPEMGQRANIYYLL